MTLSEIISTDLFSQLFFIVGGGVCAFLLSFVGTFGVIAITRKLGLLDRSTVERRRIHKVPVPRLGGVAIFLAFVIASLLFYTLDTEVPADEMVRYWLLLAAATLIVLVHIYDDIKGLKPLPKLIAQTIAVIIILGPFGSQFHGVLLFGFSNPFGIPGTPHGVGVPWYRASEITIFIDNPSITLMAIPAVLCTWFWIVWMMNTVNFIDGVDGLATGVAAITGLFITIICLTLKQPQYSIAVLSAIFTGAVLGFLPHNWNPAKIFMGDTGSQFLGLCLAVLSVIGGAKIALALMLLGIPILDVVIVIVTRLRRGRSVAQHDTTSHLHYRLLAAGLTAKQICYVFYGLTLIFGVLALEFPRIYKLIGIALVIITMAALSLWIDYRQRMRGVLAQPTMQELREEAPGGSSQDLSRVDKAEGRAR
jgi:UDP-GlcNAc:undecaprenyl-phosphate GlcNAc-1-phosphate transferase